MLVEVKARAGKDAKDAKKKVGNQVAKVFDCMQVVTRDRLARKVANVDRTKVGNIKVVASLDKKNFFDENIRCLIYFRFWW